MVVSKMLYECRPKYHPTRIFIFKRMIKLSNWFGSSTFCVQTPCSVVTVRWLIRPESGSQKSWKKWTFCVCKNDWPNPLYIQVILALYRRQKTTSLERGVVMWKERNRKAGHVFVCSWLYRVNFLLCRLSFFTLPFFPVHRCFVLFSHTLSRL